MIKMTTKMTDIDTLLKSEFNYVQNEVVNTLSRIGIECENEARDRTAEESWIDVTGNLRSSVGYTVSVNGDIKKISDFKTVKDGSEGSSTGKKYALGNVNGSDYLLTIVAGMDYAEYVEAKENKCVLASAELLGRNLESEYIKRLESKLNNRNK